MHNGTSHFAYERVEILHKSGNEILFNLGTNTGENCKRKYKRQVGCQNQNGNGAKCQVSGKIDVEIHISFVT